MTNPTRRRHITEKIGKEVTGLKSSLFVHVDYDGEPGARKIIGIRYSEKGHDGSTLDAILTALGDTVTKIIREEINPSNMVDIRGKS